MRAWPWLPLTLLLLNGCAQPDAGVVRPTGITRFEAHVRLLRVPTEDLSVSDEPDCLGGDVSSRETCLVRYRISVTNVGTETADTKCHITFRDASETIIWGTDHVLLALEPGRTITHEGLAGVQGGPPNASEVRCPAYDPGSLANFG